MILGHPEPVPFLLCSSAQLLRASPPGIPDWRGSTQPSSLTWGGIMKGPPTPLLSDPSASSWGSWEVSGAGEVSRGSQKKKGMMMLLNLKPTNSGEREKERWREHTCVLTHTHTQNALCLPLLPWHHRCQRHPGLSFAPAVLPPSVSFQPPWSALPFFQVLSPLLFSFFSPSRPPCATPLIYLRCPWWVGLLKALCCPRWALGWSQQSQL